MCDSFRIALYIKKKDLRKFPHILENQKKRCADISAYLEYANKRYQKKYQKKRCAEISAYLEYANKRCVIVSAYP